jgi:hypothetical protein
VSERKIHPGFIAALYARTDGVLRKGGERSKGVNDAATQRVLRCTRYERKGRIVRKVL